MQEFDQPSDNARIISTRPEIVALLRGLCSPRSNALMSFFDSDTRLAGRIAQINTYFDEVVFSQESASESKVPPGKTALITVLSAVKAQFHAERVEPTEFEGKLAWRVHIPKMMFCSERRENVRFQPLGETPLELMFTDPTSRDPQPLTFPIADIGTGGVAIMVHPLKLQVQIGKELRNCTLKLPDIGELTCNLLIQNITEITQVASTEGRRCGCEFSDISLDALELVKRYLERCQPSPQ